MPHDKEEILSNPLGVLAEAMRQTLQPKKHTGREMDAIVVTPPTNRSGLGNDATTPGPQSFSFRAMVPDLHNPLLKSPGTLAFSSDPDKVNNYLKQLPEFVLAANLPPPAPGDLVKVRIRPGVGEVSKNFEEGDYVAMKRRQAYPEVVPNLPESWIEAGLDLANLDWGAAGFLGSGSGQLQLGRNAATDLADEIEASGLPNDEVVVGVEVNGLTAVVEEQLVFWKDKKETHIRAKKRLKKYWDNIAVSDWTPSGTPWSAAFISFVVQKRNKAFPGSSAHRNYAYAAWQGRQAGGLWQAFSLRKEKVKIQVGDVLVKPRPGEWGSTHGDVVYKIEDDVAYLAGGNVSNTADGSITIPLGSDGQTKSRGQYVVIVKKMR